MELRPAQQIAKQKVMRVITDNMKISKTESFPICMTANPRWGKCHGENTPVLMFDGTVKMVQDIKNGDLVMGPDSKPRVVSGVSSGESEMFEVTTVKGDSFTCNKEHILSLQCTSKSKKGFEKGKILNVALNEYLGKSSSFKHLTKLWFPKKIDFQELNVFDPYIVGLYLADGNKNRRSIINCGKKKIEAINYIESFGILRKKKWYDRNNCYECHLSNFDEIRRSLVNELNERVIPKKYLINSVKNRLELLAGLLDGDGYLYRNCFEIICKDKILSDQIIFLCKSVGMSASLSEKKATIKERNFVGYYQRIKIYGNTDIIPNKVSYKKASQRKTVKDNNRVGFSVASIGYGRYYGFELDRDHLYVLGNFIVSHNTVWMADITHGALKKDNRVWILVHTQELMDQTRETLLQFNIRSGAIQGQHPDQNYAMQVQVVMNQTIIRRLEYVGKANYFLNNPEHLPDIVFIDECDVQFKARDELKKISEDLVKRGIRKMPILFIGVTGTPTAKAMGKFYKNLVIGSSVKESLEAGNLVPIRPFSCFSPDLKGVKTNAKGDWSENDLEKRVNTKELRGEIVSSWIRLGENRKTIVYATNCAHARDLADEFTINGIETALIVGDMDKVERAEFIQRFKDSKIKIIVSVMTLTRGFDCLDIGTLIMARSTKSLGLYIQMIMRGMTKNDVYDDCIVLDHSDNVARLGWPDDFLVEELCMGKKGENKDRKDPQDPLPKVCSNCNFLKPPSTPVCPRCNHENLPQAGVDTVDGEMKEMKKAKKTPAEKRHKSHSKDVHQDMWTAFLAIGKSRGHSSHLYKDYYGVYPRNLSDNNEYCSQESMSSAVKFKKAKNIAWSFRK